MLSCHDDHGGSGLEMYVIFPAVGVVEESYLSLVAQEVELPTGTSEVVTYNTAPPAPPPQPPPIVVEDTEIKQQR